MADNNRGASSSKIAFTLPISCQICLGKVKQPVVCPNQHAFCSQCMDIWLERNQQCPSCRIDITSENPCKKILGGLSHNDEEERDFSKNKELRRSRLERFCKDYEDEMERLSMENEALNHEKTVLKEQLRNVKRQSKDGDEEGENLKTTAGTPNPDMLMVLTRKLHDATGLYEKVKKDIDKLKQENVNVKDENATISRENQRLRMELIGRSPRKFGRFTVATLETKLEQHEKEMQQLQKALERSDAYIEEIEKELEGYRTRFQRQKHCVHCQGNFNDPGVETLSEIPKETLSKDRKNEETLKYQKLPFSDVDGPIGSTLKKPLSENLSVNVTRDQDGNEIASSTELSDWKKLNEPSEEKASMSIINFYGKKPLVKNIEEKGEVSSSKNKYTRSDSQFSPYKKGDTSSFDLEMPSMSMSSPCSSDSLSRMHKMALANDDDSFLEKDKPKASHTISPIESAKKKLKFEMTAGSESGFLSGQEIGEVEDKKSTTANKQVTFNQNVSVKNMIRSKTALNDSLLDVTLPSDTSEVDLLNDMKSNTSNLADDTFDMNNTMNSDIMDCMELFDSAERRLGQKKNDFETKTDPGPEASSTKETSPEMPSSSSDLSNSVPVSGAAPLVHDLPQSYSSDPSHLQNPQHLTTAPSTQPTFDHYPSSAPNWSGHYSIPSFSQYQQSTDIHGRNPSYPNHSVPSSSFNPANPSRSQSFSADLTSKYFSGSMASYKGPDYSSAPSSVPSSVSSISDPLVHSNSSYPSRPASTSTLQNMLQRINSLDSEASRPTSVPLLAPHPNTEYRPGPPSNPRIDMGMDSSMPTMMTRSMPSSGFDPSMFGSGMPRMQGSGMPGMPGSGMPGMPGSGMPGMPGSGMPGMPGSAMPGMPGSAMHRMPRSAMPGMPGSGMPRMSGSDMPRGGFSVSQPGFPAGALPPGMPGGPAMRMVSGLPGGALLGGGGLSQPNFSLGNDFSQGGSGPFNHGFGPSGLFNGGLTQ